jgi:hypothetical protein
LIQGKIPIPKNPKKSALCMNMKLIKKLEVDESFQKKKCKDIGDLKNLGKNYEN